MVSSGESSDIWQRLFHRNHVHKHPFIGIRLYRGAGSLIADKWTAGKFTERYLDAPFLLGRGFRRFNKADTLHRALASLSKAELRSIEKLTSVLPPPYYFAQDPTTTPRRRRHP